MIFKTSLFNKSLIKSDIKRYWWLSALYALLLFFILPFNHMLQSSPVIEDYTREMLRMSLQFSSGRSEFQALLICIIPVVLSALLFRYMQTTKSAAMMHSLPCSRKTHYFSHTSAGLALLAAPVVVTALVLMLLQSVSFLKECYSIWDIVGWAGITLLFNFLLYSIAVFVGMFTGNTIAHIVFTYIINVLPYGINLLLQYNLKRLIYGYGSYNPDDSFTNLPMIVILGRLGRIDSLPPERIWGFLFAAIIQLATAGYVYKIRKLEYAGDIIALPAIRPIFKYGVTACCMLLGGTYFGSVSRGNFASIIFGYLFSSFLGFVIAEMLIQKSFKVWRSYKGYLAYAAVIVVLLTGISADVTGYAGRVPSPEQVEMVYFGYNIEAWKHYELTRNQKETFLKFGDCYVLKDKENIKNITKLHSKLVQKTHSVEGGDRYIIYKLKDGSQLVRQYAFEDIKYASLMKPLYESEEYKQVRFPVTAQKPEEIQWIMLNDNRSAKKPLMLSKNDEVREFVKLLQSDLKNLTFENLAKPMNKDFISVQIMQVKGATAEYYTLDESYSSSIKWLKDKGYYESIALLPEDVEYAALEKDRPKPDNPDGRAGSQKKIQIRDAKILKELLDSYTYYDYNRRKDMIIIDFHVKAGNGSNLFQGYLYPNTPLSDELRGYLRQLE